MSKFEGSFYTEKVKSMPLIYVGGRFSDGETLCENEQAKNQSILRYHSAVFSNLGWAVISPIEMDLWAYHRNLMKYEDCIAKDLVIIKRCDVLFLAPGWEHGTGTKIEHEFALDNNVATIFDHMSAKEFVDGMWSRVDEVG